MDRKTNRKNTFHHKAVKNHPYDLLRLLRPKQWIKNSFVFTGLLFSGTPLTLPKILPVTLTAIAFCLLSSAIYVLNDLFDRENDLHHPVKKKRPIASGKVTPFAASLLGIIIGTTSLVIAFSVSWEVLLILITYLVVNVLYSMKLKQIEIVDVFCISFGFMLRILAGTIGVGIPPSNWLLLSGMMITLFLGFSKRIAEIHALEEGKMIHRAVLKHYTPKFLNVMITISATGAILTYSLYTTSAETLLLHKTRNLIFTVPIVAYGLFRYIFLIYNRRSGEDPALDMVKDPYMMGSISLWAASICLILYTHN